MSSRFTIIITQSVGMHGGRSSEFARYLLLSPCMIRASICSLLISAFVVVSPVRAENCQLQGFEVVSVAAAAGHLISVKKVKGSGSRTVILLDAMIAAAHEGEGVTCDVTFFDGGKLASNWRISNISFSGPQFTVQGHAQWPSGDPKIVVRVSLDAGHADSLRVKDVYLNGPDCTKWKDAFAPGN